MMVEHWQIFSNKFHFTNASEMINYQVGKILKTFVSNSRQKIDFEHVGYSSLIRLAFTSIARLYMLLVLCPSEFTFSVACCSNSMSSSIHQRVVGNRTSSREPIGTNNKPHVNRWGSRALSAVLHFGSIFPIWLRLSSKSQLLSYTLDSTTGVWA